MWLYSWWERFKRIDFISYWPDALGVLLLILGLMGEIPGPIPYLPIPNLAKLHQDLSNDLIAIGITVLIIDNANKWTSDRATRRQEKERLILQMGSPDHGFAIEATRQLRTRGWLRDGSLREADLIEANLREAHLGYANLRGTFLGEADLRGATLIGVDLSGADLTRAKGLTEKQIESVTCLEGATMPDGTEYKPLD